MQKFYLFVCAAILIGCSGEFEGQPSDVVSVKRIHSAEGALVEEIPYNKREQIHGLLTKWHENGHMLSQINYENGIKIGKVKMYFMDGECCFLDGKFKDSKFSGTLNANPLWVSDLKLDFGSVSKEFFGFKRINAEFKNNKIADGEIKISDDKGESLKTINVKNGKLNGELIEYENGQILKQLNYKDDLYHGVCKWLNNGVLNVETHYKNGKKDGDEILYYENGNKKEQITYSSNIPNGKFKRWFKNGQLEIQGQYKNGERDGKWTWYYENGNKKQEGDFKDDKKTGIFKQIDQEGNITTECVFEKNNTKCTKGSPWNLIN